MGIPRTKYRLYFSFLMLGLIVLFVLDILTGSVAIPLSTFTDFLYGNSIDAAHELIILKSRLPKAITAVLCGASLALSGLLMQTFFRNPLAGPYILGISSGAGLGVALTVMGASVIGLTISSSIGLAFAALLGAMIVLLILFAVSLRIRDVMTLLIFGVMLGSIATAIIGLIQYFSTDFQLKSFILWTLGSLNSMKSEEMWIMFLVLISCFILALSRAKNLNSLLVGEDFAKSLGVQLISNRLLVITISAALAAVVTAFCGPIGFIGIIIPHLCRMLFKTSNHFVLIPASILLGADVLLLSDLISHMPSNGMSLPINSITSMIGIPIIIWIIFRRKLISQAF